jgi:hypothetical protein
LQRFDGGPVSKDQLYVRGKHEGCEYTQKAGAFEVVRNVVINMAVLGGVPHNDNDVLNIYTRAGN